MINFMEKISKGQLLGIIDDAFGDRQELRLEEIIEHLLIRRAILMGVADAKAGRHLSVEEFDRRFRDGEREFNILGNSESASLLSSDIRSW